MKKIFNYRMINLKQMKFFSGESSLSIQKYLLHFDQKEFDHKFENVNYKQSILPVLETLEKQYSFHKNDFSALYKQNPQSLCKAQIDGQNDIFQLSQFLKNKFPDMKNICFKRILVFNPKITSLSIDQLRSQFEFLETQFSLTQKELQRILIIYPTIFNQDLISNATQIANIVQEYTAMDKRELGMIIARFPYFLDIPQQQIKINLKNLRIKNFTTTQLQAILKKHSEVLAINPGCVLQSFNLPKKLNISGAQLRQIYTNNPRLFTICPTTIMPKKVKLFLEYGISLEKQAEIFLENPRIFVKSIGSNELKLKYLDKRFKMNFNTDPAFPAILNYNYNETIRPRGEVMIKTQNKLPWSDVIILTDREFCQNLQYDYDQFVKLKEERPENNELDSKKRFFSKYFGNSGKFANY